MVSDHAIVIIRIVGFMLIKTTLKRRLNDV
jgi:hypothetical protein